MTTDAKIGLLLALIFIVAITFVINGLPDFLNKHKDTAPATDGYISHYQQQQPSVVGTSRSIAPQLTERQTVNVSVQNDTDAQPAETNQTEQIRYQTVLPTAKAIVQTESTAETPYQTETVEISASKTQKQTTAEQSAVYEVQAGDSLAKIAIHFYGKNKGNKLSAVEKIYNANKDKLKSMDDLQVGQKLTIPADAADKLVSTGMFEKVKIETPAANIENNTYKTYKVKELDSLWKIAQTQLGNGNRYKEIIELNKDSLKNPDRLIVGMTLKLPN